MPLELLCALLSKPETDLAVADYCKHRDYESLIHLGFINDNLVQSAVVCDECDEGHSAAVRFCCERSAYGWDCHEHGFIEKSRSDLLAFRIDAETVAKHIAQALNGPPRNAVRVDGGIYFVGRFYFAENDISIYLLTTTQLNSQSIARFIAAEPRHDRKLLLSPTMDDVPGMNIDGATLLRLDKAIKVHEQNGIVVKLRNLARLAGIESKKQVGRPSEVRADLFDLLREREAAGKSISTIKGEMHEIQKIWAENGITENIPSHDTLRRGIRKYREGVQKGS